MRILWEKEHPVSRILMMSKSLPGILPFEHAAEFHPKCKLFREQAIVRFYFTLRKRVSITKCFLEFLHINFASISLPN